MTAVLFETLLIFILILVNGVLAMSEFAVLSAKKQRLQIRASKGDIAAGSAVELASNPRDFLSTIQIGITLIGILAGAFGGATIAEQLADVIRSLPILGRYADVLAFTLVVVTITYMSLIVGELAPKRIALSHPESIASRVAGTMLRLSRIAGPVVRILSASTDLIIKLFRISSPKEPSVTEEEIKFLMDQGARAGIFSEAEQKMVGAALRLEDRRASVLMTPRRDIIWLDYNTPEENIRKIMKHPHARYPVISGNLENLVGILRAKDALIHCLSGQSMDLKRMTLSPPLFVPDTISASQLLERLRKAQTQMAMLVDEHGGIEGLVTLNDLVKVILGQLPAQDRTEEQMIVERDNKSWLIDGSLPLDELKDLLGLATFPDEENYQTLGGFILNQLARIPKTGDYFNNSGYRFEVVDMDMNRIDKVLVSFEGS